MSLYRKKALEKLQSPDRVDELLQVVHRRDGVVLAILASLALASVTWGVLGRIPITAEGQAVLVRPSTVVGFQSAAAGQLVEWMVRAGDRVRVGDPLARLEQPDLARELDQARLELEELRSQGERLEELGARASALEISNLAERSRVLEERIASRIEERDRLFALAVELREERLAALADEERRTEQLRRETGAISRDRRLRADGYAQLEKQGIVSRAASIDASEAAAASERDLSDLERQLREIESDRLEVERAFAVAGSERAARDAALVDLEHELRELARSEAERVRRETEASFDLDTRVATVQRRIDRLSGELDERRLLRSDHAGVVLELVAQEGERVEAGRRLGTLDVGTDSQELICLAYFEVKDGKKLVAGMSVQVTPDSVERERHGSLVGRVESVSPQSVSTGAATTAIGHAALASRITAEGRQIEVHARLEGDDTTPSGFRWTSRGGPDLALSAGMTARITVTVERRRPVSFVIPLLREATGIGADPDRS